MATFALFDEVVNFILVPSTAALTGEPIDFDTDQFRVALSNTAIGTTEQASYDFLNDVAQITTAGSYVVVTNAAGKTADNPVVTEDSSGVWEFSTDDVTFTAAGGTMDTFQYPVLVNSDVTDGSNNPVLIGFLNYGSGVSLATGNSFTINIGTSGWFQITVPNYA